MIATIQPEMIRHGLGLLTESIDRDIVQELKPLLNRLAGYADLSLYILNMTRDTWERLQKEMAQECSGREALRVLKSLLDCLQMANAAVERLDQVASVFGKEGIAVKNVLASSRVLIASLTEEATKLHDWLATPQANLMTALESVPAVPLSEHVALDNLLAKD